VVDTADRVAHRRRGERAADLGERRRGRHQQGLPPRSGVRRHRARALRRAEPTGCNGRALVGCFLHRRPRPVVARGPAPRGLPVRDRPHVPRRRARRRRTRR
jgi:hypothetical protein